MAAKNPTIQIQTDSGAALQQQLDGLGRLIFTNIMMADEIRDNVGRLIGYAYALGICDFEPIGFENKITGPDDEREKADENQRRFNVLRGRVKEAIINKLEALDTKKLEVLSAMGSVQLPIEED